MKIINLICYASFYLIPAAFVIYMAVQLIGEMQ